MLNVISGLLGVGGGAGAGTSYESISTVTVGSGGTSSITFSSIPSTYKHLQIRLIAQETRATYGISDLTMRFNSDSGNNYKNHEIYGDGSGVTATSSGIVSSCLVGDGTIGTNTGTSFGAGVIDILDYTNTNKNKTVRALTGVDINGTLGGYGGRVGLFSSLWMSTSAITDIVLYNGGGTDIRQYSQFALYGIKG